MKYLKDIPKTPKILFPGQNLVKTIQNLCISKWARMCQILAVQLGRSELELELFHIINYYDDPFSVSETGRNPVSGLDHCNRELAKLLSNSSYSIQVKINLHQ